MWYSSIFGAKPRTIRHAHKPSRLSLFPLEDRLVPSLALMINGNDHNHDNFELGGFKPKAAAIGSPLLMGGGNGSHANSGHGRNQQHAGPWIQEREMINGGRSNDLPAGAQHLQNVGTRPGNFAEISVLGSLGQRSHEINAHEDDGSIPLANPTGIVAGQDRSIIVRGKIGDGPHGSTGTGSGDYDYYRFSANAGQLISVNVEGQSLDFAFDPVAALYDSTGNLLTFNNNNMIYQYYDYYRATNDPSFLFSAPTTGTYYVVVFSSFNFQSSPFESSSGAGIYSEGDYNLSITTESPNLISSGEENGAIPFATATGLQAGVDGFVYASGTIGDGLYGSQGTGTGDYDVFRVDAAAGQRIILATYTDPTLHSVIEYDPESGYFRSFGMDTIITVYNGSGQIILTHDDWNNLDAYADFTAPYSGAYFVAVSGIHFSVTMEEYFFNNFLANPFDPSSGGLSGTEGPYGLVIRTETSPDRDFYSVDLQPGDVVSIAVTSGAGYVELIAPNGQIVQSTYYLENVIASPESPALVDYGDAAFNKVVKEGGRYLIAVADSSLANYNPNIAFETLSSPYQLDVRVDRPALEQQPVHTRQVLFLDFDGAPTSIIDNTTNMTNYFDPVGESFAPLRDFLPQWGFNLSDEDAFIDAMVARVVEGLANDVSGVVGRGANGDFSITGNAGEFQIDILNSRDHLDYYGIYPNVSRIVVAGSAAEWNVFPGYELLLGVAMHIDVGNYDLDDTGVVLAETMGNFLDDLAVPIAPTATRFEFFSEWFAQVILHEAGHNLGNWHTSPFNSVPDTMDNSISLSVAINIGPDGIYGSDDDVPFQFGVDPSYLGYVPESINDTLNNLAFGLSTGTKSGTYFDFVTGTLYVTGEIDDGRKDKLKIQTNGSNINVFVNDDLVLTRPAAGVNRVVLNGSSDRDELDASDYSNPVTLYGRGGKDDLRGGSSHDQLFGGEGDDRLDGGSGDDVLIGGGGDDRLDGGRGRDVLIGGQGGDRLDGESGEDLLIAGTTVFDTNTIALNGISLEWSRTDRTYSQRVANLQNGGGLNGSYKLKSDGANRTVFDDGTRDRLIGGTGRDWFFGNFDIPVWDSIFDWDSDEWKVLVH
jgi:hypothetical protein